MKTDYLREIDYKPSKEYTGIIEVKEKIGKSETRIWYIGEYNYVKLRINKFHDFSIVKREMKAEKDNANNKESNLKDWHWHHLVETNHMEAIIFNDDIYRIEYFEMPTVFVSSSEHSAFNKLFNQIRFPETQSNREVKWRYKDQKNSLTTDQIEKLRKNINKLKTHYNYIYNEYPAFRKIANNVLKYHANKLNKVHVK